MQLTDCLKLGKRCNNPACPWQADLLLNAASLVFFACLFVPVNNRWHWIWKVLSYLRAASSAPQGLSSQVIWRLHVRPCVNSFPAESQKVPSAQL